MVIKNRIEKLVSPSAVFSGYLLLGFGCVASYFSWTAFPLLLLGAGMAFSYTSAWIDLDAKRYKSTITLFGIIPFGNWMDIEPSDSIQLKHMNSKFTTYSRSNRQTSLNVNDYRVILHRDADGEKIILGRFDTNESALELLGKLSF